MGSPQSKNLSGKIFPGLTLRYNTIHKKKQSNIEYTRLCQLIKRKPKQHVGKRKKQRDAQSLNPNTSYCINTCTKLCSKCRYANSKIS